MKSVFLSLLITCLSCKQKQGEPGMEVLNAMTKAARRGDSVAIVNGKTYKFKNNTKYDTIETSLNGKVVCAYGWHEGSFMYDADGNRSKIIYKLPYRNDELSVSIADDSISVSKPFKATIWAANAENVIITSPYPDTVKITDGNSVSIVHKCDTIGHFKFEGKIQYKKGKEISFNYAFIVE